MNNIMDSFNKLDDFDKLDLLEDILKGIDEADIYELMVNVFVDKMDNSRLRGIEAYKENNIDSYIKECKLHEEYQKMVDFIENI